MITSTRNHTEHQSKQPSIFLAGSMPTHGTANWRKQVEEVAGNHYQLFDPTHPNHDQLNDADMLKHIQWEWKGLKMADKILFNFLPNAKSPISLIELGMSISSGKAIVVCPKEFYKWQYIDALCKETSTPIFSTLDEALNTIIY